MSNDEKQKMDKPLEEFIDDQATPSRSSSPAPAPNETPEKDPGEWVTGSEPMTGPQRSYLHTLAQEAGEQIDEGMTKAEASQKIEELQAKTGRGKAV
jgi:hypothetical protein